MIQIRMSYPAMLLSPFVFREYDNPLLLAEGFFIHTLNEDL